MALPDGVLELAYLSELAEEETVEEVLDGEDIEARPGAGADGGGGGGPAKLLCLYSRASLA